MFIQYHINKIKILFFTFIFCFFTFHFTVAQSITFDVIGTDSSLVANDSSLLKFKKFRKDTTTVFENISNINSKNKKKIFDDSTRNSPKHAALLGLAFPGLGQVYNKKYWKLPIVYGSMAGCAFWVSRQAKLTKEFNQYLVQRANDIELPPSIERYSTSQLETIRDTHRRNVQLASFITMMVWGFTILDAAVDAHIKPFDISDNLSMQIKPSIQAQNFNYYAALSINLNLK